VINLIDEYRIGVDVAGARPRFVEDIGVADVNIGFDVRTLDIDRVGGVDYRVGNVVNNGAACNAVFVVGLNADVTVPRGLVGYYCCVVDINYCGSGALLFSTIRQ